MWIMFAIIFGSIFGSLGWAVLMVWISREVNPEAQLLVNRTIREKQKWLKDKWKCGRVHLGPEVAWSSNDARIIWKCGACGRFMTEIEADTYFKTRRAAQASIAKAVKATSR